MINQYGTVYHNGEEVNFCTELMESVGLKEGQDIDTDMFNYLAHLSLLQSLAYE